MYFRMVTSSLIRRRSRMLVALLAVAVGATILSGLITLYYDVPRQMSQEFRSYGANLILLPASSSSALTPSQVDQIKAQIPSDKLIGMANFRYESVKIHEQPFVVAGTNIAQIKKTSPYWYINGEWPAKEKEILIGNDVARILDLKVSDQLSIDGLTASGEKFSQSFKVVGILQTGGSEESYIYMELSDLEALKGNANQINVVECSISLQKEELDQLVLALNRADPNVVPKIVKRVANSENTVLSKLQALVYIVNIVVLILTMVCVATTMMAVVAERRKEIGLKKALGAMNKSIILDFMGEAILLGAVGGVLGVIMGYFFAQYISMNVFGRAISFEPMLVIVTIIVSIVVTALSCLLPVQRATKIDPAIVLRGE